MTAIASAYAGAKARQLKRDALVIAFISVMALLASMLLLAAFAAFIAETHGPVIGLLSAAGVAVGLAVVAIVVRIVLRRRAMRRQRIATTSAASAMVASTASSMIAENKTMAIAAGLAFGVIAGTLARSSRD